MDFLNSNFLQINNTFITVKNDVTCTTTVSDMQKQSSIAQVLKYVMIQLKPSSYDSIDPIDQAVNANSSETSNLDNLTNEVPPQDSSNANKINKHENVYPLSLKLRGKHVSIATIYNEWFRLGTYTKIIPGGIYSLETLHPEWHKNNNSAFKKELSRLRLIAATVSTLASSKCNQDALVLGCLRTGNYKNERLSLWNQ